MTRIVDSHAHVMLQPYGSMRPQSPDAVLDAFARLGIEQAWCSSADALVANQPDVHRRCNDELAELQTRVGDRLVGFATVDPRGGEAAAAELERAIAELGLAGLKLHGWLQPVSCCDPCLAPLFEVASRRRLVVIFHDGTPPFTSSLQIAWLAERYPACTMILGHGGLKDLALTAAQAVRRHDNLYLQTDATTLLALRRALPLVGADKILYGSDGGFGDPRWIDYNLRKIRRWGLEPDAEAKILGGNATRLLQRAGDA